MSSKRPNGSKSAFSTFGLHKNLLRAISEAGFKEPRPIQAKTIPEPVKFRNKWDVFAIHCESHLGRGGQLQ